MDVFALIGVPFGVFLVAFVGAGYSIGGSAAGSDPGLAERPGVHVRVRRTALVLVATALALFGAAAAATAGAFSRLTDQGYAVEPAALVFALEAIVDLALATVVALPGWSARRGWVLRTVGVYWLCLAGPTLIVADAGPGWLSATPGDGTLLLGLAPFYPEAAAVLVPALLIWLASRASAWTGSPNLTA